MLERYENRLGTTGSAKLRADPPRVELDRRGRNHHLLRNPLVRVPFRQETKNFALALGKIVPESGRVGGYGMDKRLGCGRRQGRDAAMSQLNGLG